MFIPQSLLDKEVKKGSFTIKFSYQGCSELGICYQPMSNEFTFTLGNTTKSASLGTEQDQIAYALANSNVAIVLATFFGFGLLLALTPCVFPMIPILSSIMCPNLMLR